MLVPSATAGDRWHSTRRTSEQHWRIPCWGYMRDSQNGPNSLTPHRTTFQNGQEPQKASERFCGAELYFRVIVFILPPSGGTEMCLPIAVDPSPRLFASGFMLAALLSVSQAVSSQCPPGPWVPSLEELSLAKMFLKCVI